VHYRLHGLDKFGAAGLDCLVDERLVRHLQQHQLLAVACIELAHCRRLPTGTMHEENAAGRRAGSKGGAAQATGGRAPDTPLKPMSFWRVGRTLVAKYILVCRSAALSSGPTLISAVVFSYLTCPRPDAPRRCGGERSRQVAPARTCRGRERTPLGDLHPEHGFRSRSSS